MIPKSAEGGRFTSWAIVSAITLASVLLALGLVAYFFNGGFDQPFQVRGIGDLVAQAVRGSLSFQSRGLVEAGLLVLLFAPLLRLAAAIVASARQRNGAFVVIGMLVAALMLAGIFLGMR